MLFAFFIKIFPEQTNASLFAKAKTFVFPTLLNADFKPAMPTIAAIVKSVLRLAKLQVHPHRLNILFTTT